jgi:hypothetical protein
MRQRVNQATNEPCWDFWDEKSEQDSVDVKFEVSVVTDQGRRTERCKYLT